MNIEELSPDIPRFENDPRDWNWDAAVNACLSEEAQEGEGGGDPYHAVLLGSVMSIMPSGKYWTCFAAATSMNRNKKPTSRITSYLKNVPMLRAAGLRMV